jgi:protein TonB
MFDQTFVDGAGKTNKGWTVTVSVLAEFVGIGLMILVPLIWTEVLPKTQWVNSLTAPAPPPPPAPPQSAPATPTRKVRAAPRVFNLALEAPPPIPRPASIREDVTLPPAGAGDIAGGIPEVAAAGAASVFSAGATIFTPPPSPYPSKVDVKPKQEKPVLVGGNVQSAKLIKHPAPVYPAIAKTARIQGTVVLQAIIGKDGAVRNLMVVSAASPLLVSSAMDAVKKWLYQPTLLNQEPVEVITEITVIFSLQ